MRLFRRRGAAGGRADQAARARRRPGPSACHGRGLAGTLGQCRLDPDERAPGSCVGPPGRTVGAEPGLDRRYRGGRCPDRGADRGRGTGLCHGRRGRGRRGRGRLGQRRLARGACPRGRGRRGRLRRRPGRGWWTHLRDNGVRRGSGPVAGQRRGAVALPGERAVPGGAGRGGRHGDRGDARQRGDGAERRRRTGAVARRRRRLGGGPAGPRPPFRASWR